MNKSPQTTCELFYLVRLLLQTKFLYNYFRRKFYERRLFFLPEVRPMVNILQKGFNHVGLREYFFDAFVRYVCVSSANLHRPSSRQKIKTPLNVITLEELLSSVHRKK